MSEKKLHHLRFMALLRLIKDDRYSDAEKTKMFHEMEESEDKLNNYLEDKDEMEKKKA